MRSAHDLVIRPLLVASLAAWIVAPGGEPWRAPARPSGVPPRAWSRALRGLRMARQGRIRANRWAPWLREVTERVVEVRRG